MIAVIRVVLAYLLPRVKELQHPARSNCSTRLGAFSYAGMCGVIAARVDRCSTCSRRVQTLTVGNAIAYGVAMASRNAGRPAIAIGQLIPGDRRR